MSGARTSRGLYDPAWEHDACGIGAVVDITGRQDHAIIDHGRQVLLNLQHRGAAGSDESTGDGAGILIQIPHGFLAAEAERLGVALPDPGAYGVAMVFSPQDAALRRGCGEVLAEAVAHYGMAILGQREVPTDNQCLGELFTTPADKARF